jgi:hypothetical protein
VFFWSEVFGEEGLFYADFGTSFSYKEDKQVGSAGDGNSSSSAAPQKIQTISFPSLEDTLNKQWCTVTSRHFPLSKVYVKHRLLHQFRYVLPFMQLKVLIKIYS